MSNKAQLIVFTILTACFAWLAPPASGQSDAVEVGELTQPDAEAPAPDPQGIQCTVQSVVGQAQYRLGPEDEWKDVTEGLVLPVGAELRTGVRDQVVLELGPNADVTVGRLAYVIIGQLDKQTDSIRTLLGVQRGKVDFHVKQVGFRNDFRVATPTGTMAVRGTEGTIVVDETTEIFGNPNNGNNSVNFQNNSTGNPSDLTGGEQYTDGETNNGENTYNGSNNTGNGNTGTGDVGESGGVSTEALHGNTNFQMQQMEFENIVTGGQDPGGGGGDR